MMTQMLQNSSPNSKSRAVDTTETPAFRKCTAPSFLDFYRSVDETHVQTVNTANSRLKERQDSDRREGIRLAEIPQVRVLPYDETLAPLLQTSDNQSMRSPFVHSLQASRTMSKTPPESRHDAVRFGLPP